MRLLPVVYLRDLPEPTISRDAPWDLLHALDAQARQLPPGETVVVRNLVFTAADWAELCRIARVDPRSRNLLGAAVLNKQAPATAAWCAVN